MLGDKEQTLSLFKKFPVRTNVLIVDSDLITLIEMQKTMRQSGYQVETYSEAHKAIAYLTNSAHEINLVIWDLHMPKINGIEALKIIGSKLDLPVVIMSDDNPTEFVMKATIHGACDYVMKPVSEKVIATIWQHVVRKKMMCKPVVTRPVQSDRVPSHGFVQANNIPETMGQDSREQNIDMDDKDVDLLFESDLDETNSLYLDEDDLKVIYQDKDEQNIDKDGQNAAERPQMMSPDSTQSDQSNLVITDGVDVDNGEQSMDKKAERISKKQRLLWTAELHHKFLRAIEIAGGMEQAKTLKILELMKGMNVEGLTKSNVGSHLQKHRLNLAREKTREQETLAEAALSLGGPSNPHTELGLSLQDSSNAHTYIGQSLIGSSNAHTGIGPSTAYRPLPLLSSSNANTEIGQSPAYRPTLLVPSNAHTEIGQSPTYGPSSLMGQSNAYTARTSVMNGGYMNQINKNQYPNGYSTTNSNQFMIRPYSDDQHHHYLQQQQRYQQLNQYPNGYLTANSNQFMTSPVPSWSYSDNHQQQQQQYQYTRQIDYGMNNKEPEQAYGDDDIELIYPELPYDPNEYLLKGNPFYPN